MSRSGASTGLLMERPYGKDRLVCGEVEADCVHIEVARGIRISVRRSYRQNALLIIPASRAEDAEEAEGEAMQLLGELALP